MTFVRWPVFRRSRLWPRSIVARSRVDAMETGWITIDEQVPSKSNSYRIITIQGHSRLGKTPALESFEQAFYWKCPVRNLKIGKQFEFYARVFYTSMRSDIDNSLKVLLDCLQHTKTINNDNLCVKVVAEKFIDKKNPRVEFKIVTIE